LYWVEAGSARAHQALVESAKTGDVHDQRDSSQGAIMN